MNERRISEVDMWVALLPGNMRSQHLRPFCPRRNDPSIVTISWVSPTAAATGQFRLQQKMQYGEHGGIRGAKLLVAVERHPENSTRRKLLR